MYYPKAHLRQVNINSTRVAISKTYIILAFLFITSCSSRENDNENYYYVDNATIHPITDTSVKVKQLIRYPSSFGIGRKAKRSEIEEWDIDIRPDGKGLPAGSGNVSSGRILFAAKCASCHGKDGSGGTYSRLVAVMGDTTKAKTIGNYWPWSSTLFDYIRRAMPYTSPGSLSDKEVYGLTAYLLYLNKIIDSTTEMNAKTLPKVAMPAHLYFVNDNRQGGPEIR
jgi:hypothetical protein